MWNDEEFGDFDSMRRSLRTQLCYELYTTERSYLKSLFVVMQYFALPLYATDGQTSNLLDALEAQTIFSNLDEVYAVNLSFLRKLRGRIVAFDDQTTMLGDLIIETVSRPAAAGRVYGRLSWGWGAPCAQIPSLQIYVQYCSNFDDAQTLLMRLTKKRKELNAFIESTQNQPQCMGLSLIAMLVMPVQRIPRYVLILKVRR